jgi:hypothetical protein
MKTTRPVFIIGSGRSGTRMIYKLLSGIPDIEAYHEYCCTHIQPAAAKYSMGLLTKNGIQSEIRKLHGAAVYYSPLPYWVDCSNKLSWIIEPLYELFPDAVFIHVVRDGRKVVSSFFHKLKTEMYDDESVGILRNWMENPKKYPEPPPEKKYWWNLPPEQYSRFERICYHWAEINRTIAGSFRKIPRKNSWTVKLEDLTQKKAVLKKFLSYFAVPWDEEYYEFVRTPQGVFFPMDLKMTENEQRMFDRICGQTMKKLGYTGKLYDVQY